MTKSLFAGRHLLALSAVVATLTLLTAVPAEAREGAASVGHGIKCYNAAVTDPVTGKVTVTRICSKGV